jgi:hypothetical protein
MFAYACAYASCFTYLWSVETLYIMQFKLQKKYIEVSHGDLIDIDNT